jgi:hypothetical protein
MTEDQLGDYGIAPDAVSKYKSLQDALKYEGDIMGHCVGGYCDDVLSGRTKIYSLRDAKGQPHVTVEVRPEDQAARDSYNRLVERLQGEGASEEEAIRQGRKLFPDLAPRIVQIKGKQNRAPNPEYLPFVQDLVRSGKWSDVGDLQNTGLRRTRDIFNDLEQAKIRAAGHDLPEWLTAAEKQDIGAKVWGDQWGNYASGGSVDLTSEMIDRNLDAAAAQRGVPQRMANGGKVLPRQSIRAKIAQTLEQCSCRN